MKKRTQTQKTIMLTLATVAFLVTSCSTMVDTMLDRDGSEAEGRAEEDRLKAFKAEENRRLFRPGAQ